MTEISAPETLAPECEPTREDHDRSIGSTWNVGPTDNDGWRPQAHLYVLHTKGLGYRAKLSAMHEQRGDGFVSQRFGPFTPAVLIHSQDGARFNRSTLRRVYETALAELRRRFQAGDTAVKDYFDPTSDLFIA